MDLPTYTNIWRIEKRLYKLYDFRLPAPLPITWIAVFTGITVPYVVFLIAIGLPFNHNLVWLYVLPPGVLTWLTTRPVIESKRLPELVSSQLRYIAEPRTWCRMAPFAEKDDIFVSARVWHKHPPKARPKKARKSLDPAKQAAMQAATPAVTAAAPPETTPQTSAAAVAAVVAAEEAAPRATAPPMRPRPGKGRRGAARSLASAPPAAAGPVVFPSGVSQSDIPQFEATQFETAQPGGSGSDVSEPGMSATAQAAPAAASQLPSAPSQPPQVPVPERATTRPRSETKGSETKGSETKGSETKGSETKGSETRGAWPRSPWSRAIMPDTQAPAPGDEPGTEQVRSSEQAPQSRPDQRSKSAPRPGWMHPSRPSRLDPLALEVSHDSEPVTRDPQARPFSSPSWPSLGAGSFPRLNPPVEAGPFPEVGAFPEVGPFPEHEFPEQGFRDDEPLPEFDALPEASPEAGPAPGAELAANAVPATPAAPEARTAFRFGHISFACKGFPGAGTGAHMARGASDIVSAPGALVPSRSAPPGSRFRGDVPGSRFRGDVPGSRFRGDASPRHVRLYVAHPSGFDRIGPARHAGQFRTRASRFPLPGSRRAFRISDIPRRSGNPRGLRGACRAHLVRFGTRAGRDRGYKASDIGGNYPR